MRYIFLMVFSLVVVFADYKGMSNLQLHLSNQFDKKLGMIDTKNGNKATYTFEHFGKFDFGDHFFFIDHFEGDFLDGSSKRDYIEYWPRFKISKYLPLLAKNCFIKDIYIAYQYNRYVKKNTDMQAYLYGIGLDLDVPYFKHVEMNLYNRNSNLEENMVQLTFRYASFLPSGWSFTGYLDVTEDNFLTLNQLTYDIGRFVEIKKLYSGIELLTYDDNNIDVRNVVQFVIKKNW